MPEFEGIEVENQEAFTDEEVLFINMLYEYMVRR
jgi:hypothetical protein